MDRSIKALHLTKHFGDVTAVRDLNLSVLPGAIFGFLGSNGAGKTTTIDCLTGISEPDSGEVYLLGEIFRSGDVALKRRIGILPSNLALFDQLTASEFLVFDARMFGLNPGEAKRRARDLLSAFQLQESERQKIATFSTGMRKKLAFAAAVIHSPEVLFLDEPFESVDPASTATMKTWLKAFVQTGRTVFFSSHVLDVVENFCTQVAILSRGELVWEGSMQNGLEAGGHVFEDLESLFLYVTGNREIEIVPWL
jgi:ABC-2 type transport system ATP-binding protein